MNDPRFQADFDPRLYPLCNGKPPPDAGEDGQTTITLEFLAVYYEMNRAYRALLAARASNAGSEAERAAQREIERVLLARDALEDRHAPVGVVTRPEFENGFVKNIAIQHPPRPARGSSLSMVFAVSKTPGP
jgi:hypothetical protein